MPNRPYNEREWRVTRRIGGSWTGKLEAYWEVDSDSLGAENAPHDMNATEMLAQWAGRAQQRHPDLLIPITWYVRGEGPGKIEVAPFQHGRNPDDEDFLTFYDWPVDVRTGQRMEWLRLPVVDKPWNPHNGIKGGFIQEATGWKPSMLQPAVYLPSLMSALAASA